MVVDAVLLDLFGTVVAYGDVAAGTEKAWRGIHNALARAGLQLSYDDFCPRWEASFVTPLAPEHDRHGSVFAGKMARFMVECGLNVINGAVREAISACLAGWDAHLTLPDDVIPTLMRLRSDYCLALVSNFDHPPYVRDLLDRLDLTRHFDAIVISGELRVDKPDPRIFAHALEAVSCAAGRAVFVGDNLHSDIAGAQGVGMEAVLIDRRGRHNDYDGCRITALEELLCVLGELRQRD